MLGGFMETIGFGRSSRGTVPKYIPKPSEERILELFRERWEGDMDASRSQFERVWFNAAQILQGDFSGFWNAALRHVEKTPVPSWRKRYIANKVLPAVVRAISMTVGGGAKPMVVPGGGEKLYRDRALLAEKVWDSWARKKNFLGTARYHALVAATCGSSILKPKWDPQAGRLVGRKGGRLIFEGDCSGEVVTPLQFYPEPHAKNMAECQYAFHVRLMPLDEMRKRWKNAQYVRPDMGDTGTRGWIERRLRAISSMGSLITEPSTRRGRQYATVAEMWVRPSNELPDGLFSVIANDVVLEHGKNPGIGLDEERILEMPFIKFDWFEGFERFWGVGLCELLDRIIREENATKSRIIEAAILMAHPMWKAPKQSGIGDIVGYPGQVLKYNAAFPPPEQVQPTEIPQYVVNGLLPVLDADFKDVVAQHDVTQGEASSARTGVAIQLLQEKDEGVHSQGRMRFWEGLSSYARCILVLMKDNYIETRLAEIAGPNRQWQILPFRGADLDRATQIRFIMDTSLGLTRASRLGVMSDLVNLNAIRMDDPWERRQLIRMLQSNSLEELFDSLTLAEREAEEEISIMSQVSEGLPPRVPTFPWQDHAVHVRLKNHFRWTGEYKLLPPMYRQMFDANVAEHEMFLIQQQQMMAQQQMASRGAPGEVGTPSPPKGPKSTSSPQEGGDAKQLSSVA